MRNPRSITFLPMPMLAVLMFALLMLTSAFTVQAQSFTTLAVNPSGANTGDVAKSAYKYYKFTKIANWRYVACINTDNSGGDADLYGHYVSTVSRSNYQFDSLNSGDEDDCITVTATSTGDYYLAVYGFRASNFRVYVTGHQVDRTPSYLQSLLDCPLNIAGTFTSCGPLTTADYGPFGSTWGNSQESPFFLTSQNQFHIGVDWAVSAGTPVYSVYPGTVKKIGNLGSSWGYYVDVEHSVAGNTFTVAYLHLNYSGRPSEGANIEAGEQIGTIYQITKSGEEPHLHLNIHEAATRASGNFRSHFGSLPFITFYYDFINPDNAILYGGESCKKNACGSQALAGSCYCDAACVNYNDCCIDYQDLCQ